MSEIDALIDKLCPNGTVYRAIAEIANISRGQVMSKDFLRDNAGEYPVYSSQTENNGMLGKITTYMFDGEYLTWTTDGANAGTVFYRNGKFSVTNVCGVVDVTDEEVSTKYLFYALNREAPQYVNKGMGNPKLMSNVMARIRIPLPPLEVQEGIVRILDNFTELKAELNRKLEEELTARRKQYEYYRDELLTFGDEVSKVPISEIASFKYGYTDKARDFGDTRFIRITDITDDGCLTPFDAKYINLTEESKKYLLAKGDLLLARTGASYGKTLYYPDNNQAVYASFLIKIEPNNDKILNRFYWHFSKSSLYWAQAEKLVSKGGQQQFNTGAIGRVLIPVPSLDEQRRIVSVLDHFDTFCNDLTSGLPAEIAARQKQYEYYRDKLLTFKELEA